MTESNNHLCNSSQCASGEQGLGSRLAQGLPLSWRCPQLVSRLIQVLAEFSCTSLRTEVPELLLVLAGSRSAPGAAHPPSPSGPSVSKAGWAISVTSNLRPLCGACLLPEGPADEIRPEDSSQPDLGSELHQKAPRSVPST